MRESYFSADWHLFHRQIIEYCSRPFKNIREMHEFIVIEHNKTVKETDQFWLIGDVTMLGPSHGQRVQKVLEKFNGQMHLVLGNHDTWKPQMYIDYGFASMHTVMWFEAEGYRFYLAHDPSMYTVIENDPKAVLLCGHIHKLFKTLLPEKRVINVGIDVWDYKPVSGETILNLLSEK
jgi:calcineurin-like phosphoesterase family protein